MAIVNKDNFLQWDGAFIEAPFSNIANNNLDQIRENADSDVFYPLLNDVSTYGINPLTFQITVQDNPLQPATFDPATGALTYYRPAGTVVGEIRTLEYKWADIYGNESNVAVISIEIQAREQFWRVHQPSFYCVQSGGNNTGEGGWTLLEKFYADDMTTVQPLQTKPNSPGDPDYYPNVSAFAACPISGNGYGDLYLYNLSGRVLNTLVFNKGGLAVSYSVLNFSSLSPQPLILSIEAVTYDDLSIYLADAGAGPSANLEVAAGGSGGGIAAFTSGGAAFYPSITFPNDSYLGSLTIE